MRIWKFGLLLLMVVGQGCTLLHRPHMVIEGGGFVNHTEYPIENVELSIEATHEVASCNYISPGGFFGTRIHPRAYHGLPLKIRWTYCGQEYSAGPLVISEPSPVPDEPVVLAVLFHPDGIATIKFLPESEVPVRYRD
jgi:hypothetical protein